MICCSVEWCVCLATSRESLCAAHAVRRDIRPMELAPNEELIDGGFGDCEACSERFFNRDAGTWKVESTGDCAECRGTGECGDECGHGHACGHDCEACDGSGKCQTCGGSGFGGVRIRVLEAAA